MLDCKVKLSNLTNDDMLCGDCKICAGKSKFDYPFQKDLRNSDDLVLEIMKYIKLMTNLRCEKTLVDKNPDINVFDDNGNTICRIEAKYLEGQAFMNSKSMLGLYPREVLVVDEPKLDSYISCKKADRSNGKEIPIFVVWKFDKPCSDIGGITIFQEVDELERLRRQYGRLRAYERKFAKNDFNNGAKLGVTKKYHFSIRECVAIEELPKKIVNIIGEQ